MKMVSKTLPKKDEKGRKESSKKAFAQKGKKV
jgi:hypothetical protein